MTTRGETVETSGRTDWRAVATTLAPRFAERAAHHDATDTFVAANYEELRAHRVFSAGVPAELGGGGATHRELCDLVRVLARACGSTALALSMHMHQVALASWRWRHQHAPVEALLRQVAAEELVLVSSGGSDWLMGSAEATRVDGGFEVKGRKVFASGVPGGDVLLTSAVYASPESGPTVLHVPISLHDAHVRLIDTWRTLGMRGTGSQDVVLDGVFVPDAAVGVRRPRGTWHPLFHALALMAFPLIYSVYVGIAEAARDLALREAQRKRNDSHLPYLVGEMENELTTAQLALESLVGLAAQADPGPETTSAVFVRRTLAGQSAIRTVEKALEVAGGAAFYRALGLERLYRDVQAARFHPLQEKPQLRYTGRLRLGLDIDG